jgi:hypothetical protein
MKLRFATEEEQAGFEADPEGFRAKPQPNEVIRFPGTGGAGGDVQLRSTQVPPPGVDLPPPPPSSAPGCGGDFDFSNRGGFEQFVFRQIGGNPFEIDVQREVDRATAADLPKLFERVFRGQAIWADRDKLSPKQQEFWQDEVKRYRSFIKDRVASDRGRKLDMYKHMIGQYEADRKEQEAAERRVREREKAFLGRTKDEAQAEKAARDRLTRLDGEERRIMADMAKVMEAAGASGTLDEASSARTQALGAQLQRVRGERHALRLRYEPGYREQEVKKGIPSELASSHRPAGEAAAGGAAPPRPKPWERAAAPAQPSAEGPAVVRKKLPAAAPAGDATKAAGAPGPADGKQEATVNGFRVRVGAKGAPVEVRRHKSGRMLAKYADGTIEAIEEAM